MKCTTPWVSGTIRGWLLNRLHLLGLVGLVWAAWLGQPLESSLGWESCPAEVIMLPGEGQKRRPQGGSRRRAHCEVNLRAGWEHLKHSRERVLVRSCLLGGLWWLSSGLLPSWVVVLPGLEWLLEGLRVAWPWLGQQPEMRGIGWVLGQMRYGSLLLLSADVAGQWLRCSGSAVDGERMDWSRAEVGRMGPLAGCVLSAASEGEEPGQIEVVEVDGRYEVRLGEWRLRVKQADQFQVRLVILFLRLLEGPAARRGSRATRDGRRPVVRQAQLARWFGISQPNISRWEKYWLAEDWANLLSLKSAEVLTTDLRAQIVAVLARFPWRSREWVYDYLRQQGVAVTQGQVRQAAEESGFNQLRATLSRFFVVSQESIRPRDEGLVVQLLAQLEGLLQKIEAGQGLTLQEQLEVAHLQAACTELGLEPPPTPPAIPWAQKLNWLLFGAEVTVAETGPICCTYCGGVEVRLKGRKPRLKRYRQAETGEWQTVQVYRYRCDNPACAYGSFTHLPLGLLPHSPYPLQTHLAALQMYAWGRSSYRRTAQALGVRAGRAYLWVSAFGQELLPMAALFGLVRSSGVVGVDEKWVQVPDKASRGSGRSQSPKSRRWMYVYLAVDVYTYDLLHIAIYQYNTAASTRTFLLALRAKGYRPQVIVTDLRQEYGPALADIFPEARHHECIFHALQWTHRQLKDVYGADYAQTWPEAVSLKEKIDAIFQAKTKRTAQKRYEAVMAWRDPYTARKPEVASVFDTLARHWPKLVNGIESTLIPRTNNTVELVIRRFDQHYQNFCGFDSLDSARLFLAVFEKVYRFTPFTEDAQPRIRGKCPLELAGYDISELPMAQLCRGWALGWPSDQPKEGVPNA